MRGWATIFLLVHANAYCATMTNMGSPLCGYGYYKYNSECRPRAELSAKCTQINGMNAYQVLLPNSSFMFKNKSEYECMGNYSVYTYDEMRVVPVYSTGSFFNVASPMCGYGKYRLDGKCYAFTDSEAIGSCKENYHISNAVDASFMAKRTEDPVCLGNYAIYEYDDTFVAIYNGAFLQYGSPLQVTTQMAAQKCKFNPENYYKIGITEKEYFVYPHLGVCSETTEKFIVDTDCKDIDVSDPKQLATNRYCGVLCSDAGSVYTNSGVCSAKGYCSNNGKHRRLYVGLPNNGGSYSYPLYASKTSWPALNFRLPDDNGGFQTCYVNLVPPDAINHFVGKKPNPLRLGYQLDWTDLDGKDHTAPALITID